MESQKKLLLNSIGKIYNEAKGCKLEESFFLKIDNELTILSEYFRLTKNQSFFVALVYSIGVKDDSVNLYNLIEYLDCNPMKIMEFDSDFDFLYSTGIFCERKKRFTGMMPPNMRVLNFKMNDKISKAILQNQPMPEIRKNQISDIYDFLRQISELGDLRFGNEISEEEFFSQVEELVTNNSHYLLLSKIDLFKLSIEDLFIYLNILWRTFCGFETINIDHVLGEIYEKRITKVRIMQKFISGENMLLKNDLIEIVESSFIDDTEFKLTEKSLELFRECDIHFFVKKKKNANIFSPKDIPYRELIFSKSEMEQLFLLKDLLSDIKFNETQKRLADKNLPIGVTALLHGLPGTGKTEIIKQIAKETQRELIKVEISQSKSMWFGESEKIIKRIFTDYKSFAKECDRKPILLFNEADAIISKRREIGGSNVIQTENAIQNIILEELENFDGILIATTNLISNIDYAFERRFLFKILFQKPNNSLRASIWKLKLPFLSLEDCNLLAENFDFSGGQIDNIHRKKEIHEIIHEEEVTLDKLIIFCSEETLVSQRAKVGFCKS